LEGWEVWKDWEGRILSPVINGFLQLHVVVEVIIPVITAQKDLSSALLLFFMLSKYILIYVYITVVHHVRILDKNLSGTRTQLL
jgi:hypothetical protein